MGHSELMLVSARGWLALLAGLLAAASPAAAFDIGVCTHFGMKRTDAEPFFEWAEKSRITSLRDEIFWHDVEREPGVYVLEGKAQDSAEQLMRARRLGMHPLLILDYGNRFYDGGSQPASPHARKGFAAYARWLTQRLEGTVDTFEIWNEWNLGSGRRPPARYGSPEHYVALLKDTSAAIKQVNPKALVIAGAVGNDEGWPWLTQALRGGLLDHADGVSVHLYDYSMSPSARGVRELTSRLDTLSKLIGKYARGRRVPIYVTETGWPNHEQRWPTDHVEAANQAIRLLLALKSRRDVAGVWLYELRDGGTDPRNREQNFGLMTHDYQEKLVACELRALIPRLRAARTLRNFKTESSQAALFALEDGGRLLALWRDTPDDCAPTSIAIRGLPEDVEPLRSGCRSDRTPAPPVWNVESKTLELAAEPALFLLPAARKNAPEIKLHERCSTSLVPPSCALRAMRCWLN
jgi:hypothetical protein